MQKSSLRKISDFLWEIPKDYRAGMRVPARVYADEKILEKATEDRSLEQLANMATLPGIQKYALAMPDVHEGYGFPIGGVAAVDAKEGVISPGGVGYDINCGVRLLKSELSSDNIGDYLVPLINQIQRDVPSGLGSSVKEKLNDIQLNRILENGAKELVKQGIGNKNDLDNCEEGGSMENADSRKVSDRAKNRGRDELGTLGAGNHFLEVQKVDQIFDEKAARGFGLFKNQITIMIHCGSRGLGHQIADDYIREFLRLTEKRNIKLVDRELVFAPISIEEGQNYFSAMAAGANFAWANRHTIAHNVRMAWRRILGDTAGEPELVYDVAHNMAKFEKHEINGQEINLCVHRKGATRAFPAGREELPEHYRYTGQPVIIPGTMGTASYVLVGAEGAMRQTFGSVCHGAGRIMSRGEAKRSVNIGQLRRELERKEIIIRVASKKGLAEEAPMAYKDIDNVVRVVAKAGLARKVAKLRPLGVVKG